MSNIKNSLKDISCTFTAMHSRYLISDFLENDFNGICETLKKIAGVHTFSPVFVVNNDYNEILNTSLELFKDKFGTFKVETNRADKTFTPNSVET